MILKELLQKVDVVLERIEASQPDRYDRLQRSLLTCDVSVNREYQRLFNGYYHAEAP